MNKVLVTGAAGYLGSVLVPALLDAGFEVRALDRFFFPFDPFTSHKNNCSLEVVNSDTRIFDPVYLKGIDAVIDLAAVAQTDPDDLLPPAFFYDINYTGAVRLATLSKRAGVPRYIYASSTSVYGIREETADENSPVGPVEIYARTKYTAEQKILGLNGPGFSVTALRFATLYGYAPKMRFDLLVNRMTLSACTDKTVFVGGGGEQKRVILHVRDAAAAVVRTLQTDGKSVSGQVFNIGSNDQNFKIIEIAKAVASLFPDVKFVHYGETDKRSFRVNFEKAGRVLHFVTRFTLVDGVIGIEERVRGGLVPDEQHFVIPWWEKLVREGKVRAEDAIPQD